MAPYQAAAHRTPPTPRPTLTHSTSAGTAAHTHTTCHGHGELSLMHCASTLCTNLIVLSIIKSRATAAVSLPTAAPTDHHTARLHKPLRIAKHSHCCKAAVRRAVPVAHLHNNNVGAQPSKPPLLRWLALLHCAGTAAPSWPAL